jgi:hypothetical protein
MLDMAIANCIGAKVTNLPDNEKQAIIWDYYRPRHIHAWNMLVWSWRALDAFTDGPETPFEAEYLWENFIIRLWLYRTTVRTLTHLHVVSAEAKGIIAAFDVCFHANGKNCLRGMRDMIEHFDDYAAGAGRGPATREGELDPWRTITRETYERGQFLIERETAWEAAMALRSEAKRVSDLFIAWYKASK